MAYILGLIIGAIIWSILDKTALSEMIKWFIAIIIILILFL